MTLSDATTGPMSSFHYFAFGSNMLAERLRQRCPSAEVLGPARAHGHRLTFSKRGWLDGSGKCALVPRHDDFAHGVLYRIAADERTQLDHVEGVGQGYRRFDRFMVRREHDGSDIAAVTYIATHHDDALVPFDWYRALVLAGAIQNRLRDDLVDQISAMDVHRDPEPERPSRLIAIAVLRRSGFGHLAAACG